MELSDKNCDKEKYNLSLFIFHLFEQRQKKISGIKVIEYTNNSNQLYQMVSSLNFIIDSNTVVRTKLSGILKGSRNLEMLSLSPYYAIQYVDENSGSISTNV